MGIHPDMNGAAAPAGEWARRDCARIPHTRKEQWHEPVARRGSHQHHDPRCAHLLKAVRDPHA
jgi:hypothetical protein